MICVYYNITICHLVLNKLRTITAAVKYLLDQKVTKPMKARQFKLNAKTQEKAKNIF